MGAEHVCISLGWDCRIAYQLDVNSLRGASLPFDWTIAPFETVYQLLENDFAGLLEPENLVLTRYERPCIEDRSCGLRFLHDFALHPGFISEHAAVAAKYWRRIERFREILDTPRTVTFFRYKVDRAQAERLIDLLQKQFPKVEADLILFDETDEIRRDWKLPRTRNYYIPPIASEMWWGDTARYSEVLQSLGLPQAADRPKQLPIGFWHAELRCLDPIETISRQAVPPVRLELTNRSPITWLVDGIPQVRVGYHWLNSDRSMYRFDGERADLESLLEPGETAAITAHVDLPAEPGDYILQWDLVVEHIDWFSSHGWECPEALVRVT